MQQSSSYQSPERKKGLQVLANDDCEKTGLFRVSILARVQINEECLPCNVESREKLSLADTSNLVMGRLFGC